MSVVRHCATFLGEFLSHPMTTGAIAPSSTFLAKTITGWADIPNARFVLEYGPGTGIFTDYITLRLAPGARFAAIEINSRLAELFRHRHPGLTLIEDSVANVSEICGRLGFESVDCIICGLPWASFPEASQVLCMDAMMKVLKPGGQFVTFAYLQGLLLPTGRRFARLLPRYFSHVSKSRTVWLNMPPAFVYQCRR